MLDGHYTGREDGERAGVGRGGPELGVESQEPQSPSDARVDPTNRKSYIGAVASN